VEYCFKKRYYSKSNNKKRIRKITAGVAFTLFNTIYNKRNDMSKRLTTSDFIKRAKEIHGDKYDYSKVKYERRDKNVIIIDKEDGSEFLMTPACHLSGQDNPKRKWKKLN